MHPGSRGKSEARGSRNQSRIIAVFDPEPQGTAVVIAPDQEEMFVCAVIPEVNGRIEQQPIRRAAAGPVLVTVIPERDRTLITRDKIGIDGIDRIIGIIGDLAIAAGAGIAGTGRTAR